MKNTRACFIRLRILRDQLANMYGNLQLSMGMSGDFEIAIEEGANVVRVGRLFLVPAFLLSNTPDSGA